MISHIIEHHVVTFRALGEIFFGIIDDMIGTERFHKIDIPRAANAGHIRTQRFRDLDCKRANTAGRAVN